LPLAKLTPDFLIIYQSFGDAFTLRHGLIQDLAKNIGLNSIMTQKVPFRARNTLFKVSRSFLRLPE